MHGAIDSSGKPDLRWNSVGEQLTGDRYNGTFEPASASGSNLGQIVWNISSTQDDVWTTPGNVQTYTANFVHASDGSQAAPPLSGTWQRSIQPAGTITHTVTWSPDGPNYNYEHARIEKHYSDTL